MANFASFASATTAGGGSQDELSKLLADFGDAGDFVTGDDDDVNIGADQGQDWEDDDLDAELAAEDAAEAARQGGQPLNPLEAAAAQVQLLARTEEDDAMDDVRHFIKREPSSDEDDEDGEDDYEDDSIAEVEPATQGIDPALLAAFPSFKPGAILDFTDLMAMPPKKRPKLDVRPAKVKLPNLSDVPLARSTLDATLEPLQPRPRSQMARLLGDSKPKQARKDEDGEHIDDAYRSVAESNDVWVFPAATGTATLAPEVDDWEAKIVWKAPTQPIPQQENRLPFRNPDLESGDWTRSIIWDRRTPYKDFTRLQLSAAQMAHMPDDEDDLISDRARALALGDLDPLNISNDKVYEAARERRSGVRQTLSSLEVQHAYPAKKLQMPFYKIQLSKSDARAFHRPAMQFPSNIPLTFSKVRSTKKKRDKVSGQKLRSAEQIMHNTADLSLRDTAPFVLLEYSEEYPPIMSNLGMGSILVNYYRKRTEKEEVPTPEFGETFPLEPSDETPFRKFGDVAKGQTVQALYNELVRAPLFRHTPAPTDFLVIRCSGDGETRYYIREIPHLFVVGQTLPLQEVPGPHSRRLTALTKARLMLIARRLCSRGDGAVHMNKLLKYFDDHTQLQMRQRIKDFMKFSGNHQWSMLPPSEKIPSESDNRAHASPEECVLYEAMLVGQRHLLDAGYGKAAGSAEGGNEDDAVKLDVEQQLAPWTTTKNFMLASQNKAMLALNGEGDPTGRGEGISMLRISMKGIFVPAGVDRESYIREQRGSNNKYNVAEQQEVYKKEIKRIWAAQAKALSDTRPVRLTDDDEQRANRGLTPSGQTPADSVSPGMFGEGTTPGGTAGNTKILKIRRKVGDKIVTERVKDPRVIAAYIRQRQVIEEETQKPEDLSFGANEAQNERIRAALELAVANLKRNQARRLARKNAEQNGAPLPADDAGSPSGAAAPSLIGNKVKSSKPTSRVCGNCGQTGHMKTNKNCPRFAEFNPGGPPKKAPKKPKLEASGSGVPPPPTPDAIMSPAVAPTPPPLFPSLAAPRPAAQPSAASPPPPKLKVSFGGGAS